MFAADELRQARVRCGGEQFESHDVRANDLLAARVCTENSDSDVVVMQSTEESM
jgi:hypothetical protein